MPTELLETVVKDVWTRTKSIIINGVNFTISGDKVYNNLPGKTDNDYFHVRPKSNKSAYKLNNGFKKGNIYKDANELPNGEWMTTQCFFIKNRFIEQLIGL